MKKFFMGFAVGIVFVGVMVILLGLIGFLSAGARRTPRVARNSALVLNLEGSLPEQPPATIPLPFFEQQQPLTVAETWNLIRRASTDSRIKALVLEPRGLSVGWAKLQELRGDLIAFKKSGKPIYAYLRGAGTREYYLATAADRIFISPEDELDVKGMRAELSFVKGTLDKLGVKMEFEHVGKYKDAPDMFTKDGSSPETREVLNQLLDQFYGDFVNAVAEGRGRPADAVRMAIDNGPFVGAEAKENGFVDELAYEDQMYAKLEAAKGKFSKLSSRTYARALGENLGATKGARVALVVGQGDITRGGTNAESGDDGITTAGMVKLLRDVREDDSIKAVILRVDSPGGDGIASDDILHEAKLLSQKKPVVISMSDLAASGGYYISMTGDPVVAYPNTETGSIGVFFGKVNLHGLYDKLGVNKESYKRGRFADIDREDAPLNDAQRAKLRSEIEVFYHDFVQRVSDSRKRKYDDVEALAQGRVWTGTQAKQNGLVDELGGIDQAIAMIKQRANIPSSQGVTLVPYPARRTVLDRLLDGDVDLSAMGSRMTDPLEARLQSFFGESTPSLLHGALAQGGILSLMPYRLVVH